MLEHVNRGAEEQISQVVAVTDLKNIFATVFGDDCLHGYDVQTAKQLATLVHPGTKSAHKSSFIHYLAALKAFTNINCYETNDGIDAKHSLKVSPAIIFAVYIKSTADYERCSLLELRQESLADAKVSARQQCVYEGL